MNCRRVPLNGCTYRCQGMPVRTIAGKLRGGCIVAVMGRSRRKSEVSIVYDECCS